jgi:tetratricopeptide (TPR) repeat protein
MLKILALTVILLFMSSQVVLAGPSFHSYNYDSVLRPVPSPAGYAAENVLGAADLGLTGLSNPSDLFYTKKGEIFLVDTGNHRLIVLDRGLKVKRIIDKFTNKGKEDRFNEPHGVFVTEEDRIYVADTQNGRIVILNQDGSLKGILGEPESDVLPPSFEYKPQKLIVDKGGRIFVVAESMVEGLIQLNSDGVFNKFFGGNRVRVNPAELILRKFLTKEQREKRILFVPVEYVNLTMDSQGFIYTSTKNQRDDQIKRLNASGINIIRHEGFTWNRYGDLLYTPIAPQFVDLSVDEYNNVLALDNGTGRIYQYNVLGDLLFVFGGFGENKGLFKNPAALEQIDGKVYVLDQTKGTVTVFAPTDFGKSVLSANNCYVDGKYEEALQPWREVLKRNANYDLAYVGIGNAYLKQEKYKEAMEYFRLAYYRSGYSKALKEYRSEVLREHFSLLMVILFIVILLLVVTRKQRKALYASFRNYINA